MKHYPLFADSKLRRNVYETTLHTRKRKRAQVLFKISGFLKQSHERKLKCRREQLKNTERTATGIFSQRKKTTRLDDYWLPHPSAMVYQFYEKLNKTMPQRRLFPLLHPLYRPSSNLSVLIFLFFFFSSFNRLSSKLIADNGKNELFKPNDIGFTYVLGPVPAILVSYGILLFILIPTFFIH